MPSESSSAIERLRENANRVVEDVGHVMNGKFGKVSPETQKDIAEAVRNHMEGRTGEVRIPINDHVTIEGHYNNTNDWKAGIRVDF